VRFRRFWGSGPPPIKARFPRLRLEKRIAAKGRDAVGTPNSGFRRVPRRFGRFPHFSHFFEESVVFLRIRSKPRIRGDLWVADGEKTHPTPFLLNLKVRPHRGPIDNVLKRYELLVYKFKCKDILLCCPSSGDACV